MIDFGQLFDDAPCGFLVTDLDGLIQQVNSRFASWTGYAANELIGRRTFQELLSLESQIEYQTHFAPTLGLHHVVRDVALELNGINGQPIHAVTNAELHEATTTKPARVWLVLIDATARRSLEQESQRARQRLARLQRLTSAFAVAQTRQEVVSVTVAEILDGTEGDHGFLADVVGDNLRILEALPHDEVARAAWEASDIPNIPLLAQSMRSNTAVFMENSDGVGTHLPPLRTDGVTSRRVALLPMATAGRARGVLCVASSKEGTFQADERAFLVLFAELTAQAIERARLHDDAIVRTEQMVFLAELGGQLDEATTFQGRAQRLVDMLVPSIADVATVEIGYSPAEPIARAQVNPLLVEPLGTLRTAGKPNGTSFVRLPLLTRGVLVGTLTLSTSESGRGFQESDLLHLREVASRAALALENARIYDHQRQVSASFQQHLLKRAMPSDPRVELTTRYQAGGELVEIGGDFFDAFFVTPNRLAVAVGDVVGRGIPAATVMGQIRTALRAYALEGRGPATTLERLDRFAESIDGAFCSSVAYAELDLETGELRYSCAGHPPPVLVLPAGRPEVLWDGRSPLLGIDVATPKPEAIVQIPPGGRLLLYSDGLVETRARALDDGIATLVTHLDADRDIALDRLAELIEGHDAQSDDICVLSLTRRH